MQNSEHIPIFFWLIFAYIGYVLIAHVVEMYRRKRWMPVLAAKLGLKQWGDGSLPPELSLDGSDFANVLRTFNVFEETVNGVRVAIFDVAKRAGRSTAYFTVIAAQGDEPFGAEAFDPDLATARSGEWTLLYRPRNAFSFTSRLLPMEQIEAQLKSVRSR